MNFTEEQLKKMNTAKTAEELIAIAKAEGIEATEEQIRAQFDAMHKEGELADEEVGKVNGGMKIILTKSPKFFSPLLRLIYKSKKPSTDNADTDAVITGPVIADSDDIDLEDGR